MSTSKKEKGGMGAEMTRKMVVEYLQNNPDFLKENTGLFAALLPPEARHGDDVLDFQHYMLGNLQKNIRQLQGKYEGLVGAARDNMSVQSQVHRAVLGLIKARELEQLLAVITFDLMQLFEVDVVRLAMESEAANLYETYYSEYNYSGIAFIEPGVADAAMGQGTGVLLVSDTQAQPIAGFEQIFADCDGMIASCALLRLKLEDAARNVILAFGSKEKERFHPGQGVEMLSFLAQIVEHQLDACLRDSEIGKLI